MSPGGGSTSRALVLGGGGLTGIAWELGLLGGLAEAGVDLGAADLIVGTSAGAVVGAQITSGCPLEELVATQLDPAAGSREIAVAFDAAAFRASMADAVREANDAKQARARLGQMALVAETPPEAVRRRVIAGRLPVHDWPERRLVVTAVDAETGEFVTFDRHSGVGLVDAVAASCAVPGIWPPATVGGRRYIDGGMRSGTNADVAQGCATVVVLVPVAIDGALEERLQGELAVLGEATTFVVCADAASLKVIGSNHLDPGRRPAAARAGRRQAAAVCEALAELW